MVGILRYVVQTEPKELTNIFSLTVLLHTYGHMHA